MKFNKPNVNINIIQSPKNKLTKRNKLSKEKKSSYLSNPLIIQLIDKEVKIKKKENKLSPNFSYRNFQKINSNNPNSDIKEENNNINIRLNLNSEIINNNYFHNKKKHHSSDQIYNEKMINLINKKDKKINQLKKALNESESILKQLQKQKNKSLNEISKNSSLTKNNSKKILNLKISKKNTFNPTFNSTTTTNSNYISNEQNYTNFFSNPTSTRKKINNKFFSPTQNNILYNSDDNSLNNRNFTPENNKKNNCIFANKIYKDNQGLKIIKVNSRNIIYKSFDLKNNLEKLKKRTKNILNAYLVLINKEH